MVRKHLPKSRDYHAGIVRRWGIKLHDLIGKIPKVRETIWICPVIQLLPTERMSDDAAQYSGRFRPSLVCHLGTEKRRSEEYSCLCSVSSVSWILSSPSLFPLPPIVYIFVVFRCRLSSSSSFVVIIVVVVVVCTVFSPTVFVAAQTQESQAVSLEKGDEVLEEGRQISAAREAGSAKM